MKISIITVCYNSEKTIQSTIDSITSQTFKNYELIVIDGKSQDHTLKIINSNYKKINKIVSEEDNGLYQAINKGLKLATGDIISILHSNDIYFNNRVLEKINELFINNKIDYLLTSICFKKDIFKKKIYRIYNSESFQPWMLRFGYSPPHPGFFALKKVYNQIGIYNENYQIASDYDFFVRLFATKRKFLFKKKNMLTVTMSLNGLSTQGIKSNYKTTIEILNCLKKNGLYSNFLLVCMRFVVKVFQFKF